MLRWFDRDLLGALRGHAEREWSDLLADGLVAPAGGYTGAYRLRDEIRPGVLARLRDERPLDELAFHTQAFEYFLRRLEQREDPEVIARRVADEESCFYHLAELRELLTERREWQTIARYVAAARAAGPRQARHLDALSLYEGFVAVRTQDFDRGEAILTALLGRTELDDALRVRALQALGQVHWFHTRYDRALVLWEQAHALACDIGDLPYQSRTLLNMSVVYHETGYYDRALDLGLQSLRMARELGDRQREAHALWEVGNSAMQLGRWQDAQGYLHEAIRRYEALGVTARLANIYWCQGFLHHLLGDEVASEVAYRRGLAIAQSPEHSDPPVAMDLFWYLGILYQTQGRWEEALASYERAIDLAHQLRNQHSLTLIHFRRGDVLRRRGRLDEAFAAYREAIDGLEALRGVTEGEAIKIGLVGTTQQLYEAMVLLCLEQDRPDEAFDYVERARSRAFLDTLMRKSPELYDAVAQPVATLAEIQARLPEGALLLEYFTVGVLPRGEHLLNKLPPENARLREHLTLPPQILIFAVARDRFEVHRAALNPNSLRPQPGEAGPGRRLLHAHLLAHLYERLVAPVRRLLAGRDLLYLIPHGPLHYVPFAALRPAAGAGLLDEGGPALALAPSATILLRNCLDRPAGRAEGFLALGYNDEGEDALRYAEVEARHLARLAGGRAWTGPAPKGERLLAEGRRARWLHFAGHAVFDPHDPLGSTLRLGAGDALSARAIIDGLDLDAELVTLSACTTGLSHVVPGDELLGLQRAFLYAGAPTVVCTLWEADDVVALLVMERFYADLREGRPAAAALRDAQLAVRGMTGREVAATLARWRAEDPEAVAALDESQLLAAEADTARPFADPFHWAPFMLIGRPHAR